MLRVLGECLVFSVRVIFGLNYKIEYRDKFRDFKILTQVYTFWNVRTCQDYVKLLLKMFKLPVHGRDLPNGIFLKKKTICV